MSSLMDEVLADEDRNKPILVGDLVHLKSGGPTMTVFAISEKDVDCEWFDKSSHKQRKFKMTSLRRGPFSRTPIISLSFNGSSGVANRKPPWTYLEDKLEEKDKL